MKTPYLVQRLKKPSFTLSGKGADGVVLCDYMGASEFEWGVLGRSLKQMRAEPKIECFTVHKTDDHPALIVISLPEDKDEIIKWFEEELKGAPKHHSKESTYIRPKYTSLLESKPWAQDIVGWWAVNAGDEFRKETSMSWAVFDDVEIGKKWFKALRDGKEA